MAHSAARNRRGGQIAPLVHGGWTRPILDCKITETEPSAWIAPKQSRTAILSVMKIRYNAPVTLTFCLLATIEQVLAATVWPDITRHLFTTVPHMSLAVPANWLRLCSYVIGHASWHHLVANVTVLLLLGPMLEEKYGSRAILGMMVVAAFLTGLLHALFMPSGLLGASGLAFMFIVLASIADLREGEIPLSFIVIVALFMGRELWDGMGQDHISQMAHLVGGVFGAVFGFTVRPRPVTDSTRSFQAEPDSAGKPKENASALPRRATSALAKMPRRSFGRLIPNPPFDFARRTTKTERSHGTPWWAKHPARSE